MQYIYTVKTFQDLNPTVLTWRRIALVEDTKSVIVGDKFLLDMESENYVPGLGNDKRDLFAFSNNTNTTGIVNLFKIPKIFNPSNAFFKQKDQVFHEISHANAKERLVKGTRFFPFGDCVRNEASTKAQYTRAFAVGGGGGVSYSFAIAIYLNVYSTQGGFGTGVELSGGITCDVPPYNTLQVQMRLDRVRISGMRSRQLKIQLAWNFGKTFEASPWKEEPVFEEARQSNFMISCVTDPELLQCSWR
ncbi:uncharacterized protein KQ657_001561 [Scheffersomyces spartinae]|uniref:Uncharacterized protein n=1 Tax=Scheffersomyces spartinae TaxID=45513 RepID=A0A9P8AHK1_9ASCO|nr:uncharacterized protein KQ657_001561 [Scheffersomyces spartinae]KAG7192778.1 hypothetical protein KQ657_001561 [Scheffersomyces spartinae]